MGAGAAGAAAGGRAPLGCPGGTGQSWAAGPARVLAPPGSLGQTVREAVGWSAGQATAGYREHLKRGFVPLLLVT